MEILLDALGAVRKRRLTFSGGVQIQRFKGEWGGFESLYATRQTKTWGSPKKLKSTRRFFRTAPYLKIKIFSKALTLFQMRFLLLLLFCIFDLFSFLCNFLRSEDVMDFIIINLVFSFSNFVLIILLIWRAFVICKY